MRLILKILAAPVMVILWVLCAFCKLLVVCGGVVLSILSVIVLILSVLMFISGNAPGGIAGFVIAFLICPFGLPKLAALLVGSLYGVAHNLRHFITT
jgi:hypothetical protein